MKGILFVLCCIEILGAVLCGTSTISNSIAVSSSKTSPVSTSGSQQDSNNHSTRTLTPTTPTNTTSSYFCSPQCHLVFMVAGGLIIACTILLISTLVLACTVCQLSTHVKVLRNNADLISNTEYWMGTDKESKIVSGTEAKETTMLMVDIVDTQEDVAEEEMGEKNEVANTAEGKKASSAPETAAKGASSSRPPEEATDLQSVKAGAAPSAGCNEEPKEKV